MGKLFDDAIRFAVQAHAGQNRKGCGIPYITHPMEAAAIAAGITEDEEIFAAAVLHDTLEDTDTAPETLSARFGERVAALVMSQSEDKRRDLPAEDTWEQRKSETLSHMSASGDAELLLALCDKLSNLRAIARDQARYGPDFWNRFNQKDPAAHAWYYGGMAKLFSARPALRDTAACREFNALTAQVFPREPE